MEIDTVVRKGDDGSYSSSRRGERDSESERSLGVSDQRDLFGRSPLDGSTLNGPRAMAVRSTLA